jgi:HK97 family phage major capsid protein
MKPRHLINAPAVHGLNADAAPAMNRHDYLHEVSLKKGRFGRKDAEKDVAALQGQVKAISEAMNTRNTELADAVKKAHEEAKAAGAVNAETLTQLKAIAETSGAMQARMVEVEQKLSDASSLIKRATAGKREKASATIVGHEDFKAFKEKGAKGTVSFQVKALNSLTTGSGAAGDLVAPDRISTIIRPQDRPLTILDLIGRGRTSSNAIEYFQETGFQNNAEPVAELAQKPESDIQFTMKTTGVKTIARWIAASKQIMDDVPMLESYVDDRLRYGLDIVLEEQVLAGDGTGQNLLGLIPEATPYNRPASATRIDVIRRSITQVRFSEYRATGVVLHPADWEEIELTKTTEGAYVWANPFGLLNPTIWGLRVVDTMAMDEGDFLTGAFEMAATFWDREQATVAISDQDRDNFIKNALTIRAELRGALAVWRPEALVFGDFAAAISG